MKKILTILFTVVLFCMVQGNSVLAQQGCCSWHGGISYCDSSVGRYVCGDGTYSPSCTCLYTPPDTTINVFYDEGQKWCGYGKWYDSKTQANKSIQDATDKVRDSANSEGYGEGYFDATYDCNIENKGKIHWIWAIGLGVIGFSVGNAFGKESDNGYRA